MVFFSRSSQNTRAVSMWTSVMVLIFMNVLRLLRVRLLLVFFLSLSLQLCCVVSFSKHDDFSGFFCSCLCSKKKNSRFDLYIFTFFMAIIRFLLYSLFLWSMYSICLCQIHHMRSAVLNSPAISVQIKGKRRKNH